jgi:hypothetical protein
LITEDDIQEEFNIVEDYQETAGFIQDEIPEVLTQTAKSMRNSR